MTTTPERGYIIPDTGDSGPTWKTKLDTLFTAIDTDVAKSLNQIFSPVADPGNPRPVISTDLFTDSQTGTIFLSNDSWGGLHTVRRIFLGAISTNSKLLIAGAGGLLGGQITVDGGSYHRVGGLRSYNSISAFGEIRFDESTGNIETQFAGTYSIVEGYIDYYM